jgi:hypothetical protein
MNSDSSRRKASRRYGVIICRVHSSLTVRMNRSTTARLPYLPTAPKRCRILFQRHHRPNAWSGNCLPWSVIKCRGVAPAFLMTRPRKVLTALDVDCWSNTANPMTRREKRSTATAIHQQNGHCCGNAQGSHEVQNPEEMGTALRSTCQT